MFRKSFVLCRRLQQRGLATRAHMPGSDPLDILRKECVARQLCDEQGFRLPGVHWVCAIATMSAKEVGQFNWYVVVVLSLHPLNHSILLLLLFRALLLPNYALSQFNEFHPLVLILLAKRVNFLR